MVSNIIDTLKEYFGGLKTTRGRKHTFLGINFEILSDGKVELEMIDQLRDAIEIFGEVIDTNAATPSKHFLFDVSEDVELLDKKRSENFSYSSCKTAIYHFKDIIMGYKHIRILIESPEDKERVGNMITMTSMFKDSIKRMPSEDIKEANIVHEKDNNVAT